MSSKVMIYGIKKKFHKRNAQLHMHSYWFVGLNGEMIISGF